MGNKHDNRITRTDIWREGKWLDLWSVVHLLSGISIGLSFYFLHLGIFFSILFALLLMISYELWEIVEQIKETPTNRFMDVIVGMAGFLPAFFILAPPLSTPLLILVFGFIFVANVILSIFGWRASQKAAALQERLRAQFAIQRARLLSRNKTRQRILKQHSSYHGGGFFKQK